MIHDTTEKRLPVVAVSACLMGQRVRYDGTDKAHQLIKDMVLPHIQALPICPEAGAGLGVPRPPVQLVQFDDTHRAIGRDDPALDVTASLVSFADSQADALEKIPDLCGHIFKSRSPSCGLGSTPVHDSDGRQLSYADGLYAAHIARRLPWLLLIEETALESVDACNNFLQKLLIVRDIRSATTPEQLLKIHHRYISLWKNSSWAIELQNAASYGRWQKYSVILLQIIRA